MEKYTPEEIISILHSIKKIVINDNNELDIFIDYYQTPYPIDNWMSDTFTRDLLDLIDAHLLNRFVIPNE